MPMCHGLQKLKNNYYGPNNNNNSHYCTLIIIYAWHFSFIVSYTITTTTTTTTNTNSNNNSNNIADNIYQILCARLNSKCFTSIISLSFIPPKSLFLFIKDSNHFGGRAGRGFLFNPEASIMSLCCYQTHRQ